MATLTLTNPTNGTTADANLIANNNDAIEAVVNGGIDNANVSGSAAISASKLAAGTDGFIIRTVSGVPTWVTPMVGCKVYRTSNVTVTQGAAATAIAWDNEEFDTDSFHDNVTNNTRLTVPAAKGGKYQLNVMIELTGAGNSVIQTIDVFKNGATVLARCSIVDAHTTAAGQVFVISTVISLAAADYIEIRALKAAAANNSTIIGSQAGCAVSLYQVGL